MSWQWTKAASAACEMLETYDEQLMSCYPVSARINHVANDDADCSAPDPSSVEIRMSRNKELFSGDQGG